MKHSAGQSGPPDRASVSRASSGRALRRAALVCGALAFALAAVAATAVGTAENSLPGAPSGVKASRGETGTVALVSWVAPPAGSGVASFRVWRSEDDADFVSVAAVTSTSFTDKVGVPGASYRYRVTACTADGGESLPSSVTDTITVEWTIAPHYRASSPKGISALCRICHVPHSADASESLLRGDDVRVGESAVCYRCHDGSGAQANVASGPSDSFGLVSGHTVEESLSSTGTDLTNSCSDCHHLHGNATSDPDLRPSFIAGDLIGTVTVTSQPNSWCFACHDERGSWYAQKYGARYPARAVVTRDGQGYPIFGSFPGPAVYRDPAANEHAVIPASAEFGLAQGDCLFCHAAHRGVSRYDGLRAVYRPSEPRTLAEDQSTGAYAALCFICHGGTRPSYLQTVPVDIKRYVTSGSRNAGHRIVSDGGLMPFGSPLPCYDCHNPHGSRASAFGLEVLTALGPNEPVVIGDVPGEIVMGAGATPHDVRHFCLTCHTTSDTGAGWNGRTMAPVVAGARVEGIDRTSFDGALRLSDHPSHSEADARSCTGCHGDSYLSADSFNVHNPNPGRPAGATQCDACHDVAPSSPSTSGEPSAVGSAAASATGGQAP